MKPSEALERLKMIRVNLEALEMEYKGKLKGENYMRRQGKMLREAIDYMARFKKQPAGDLMKYRLDVTHMDGVTLLYHVYLPQEWALKDIRAYLEVSLFIQLGVKVQQIRVESITKEKITPGIIF